MAIIEQLKAQELEWIGGLLVDFDAPHKPTTIIGFEVTPQEFAVIGLAFTWRAKRDHLVFSADERRLCLSVPCLSCTIEKPKREAAERSKEREEGS